MAELPPWPPGGGGVTLPIAESDVLGLVADLAAKQTGDAELSTLAGLSAARASELAAVTSFIGTLLNDPDVATALVTLGAQAADTELSTLAGISAANATALVGITAYIRTLLDDVDASAALGTLGVSTFIKTLLDDVDAAAARATLGVTGGTGSVFPEIRTTAVSTTVASSDMGGMVGCTNASPTDIDVTIPTNAADPIPLNSFFRLRKAGTGAVNVIAPGVTIRSPLDLTHIADLWGQIEAWKQGTNNWWLSGDLG
jgi:hypothetical protein